MEFATRAIHAGQDPDPATGAAIPPLHLSTIFEFQEPGVSRAGFEYTRYGNPTRHALEVCLAALEGAPEECPALCFSSGMAATDAAMRLLKPGDRAVLASEIYGGTYKLAEKYLRPAGIRIEYADATNLQALEAALSGGAQMLWLETPSNPLLRLTDLSAAAELGHRAGAIVAVDSTFGTPYLQNPLAHGVDLVMHSTTKYLGGHSDVLGGALVVRDLALRARLYDIQIALGAVAAPFDCWLTLRGVRSLAARMKVHQANAAALGDFLRGHRRVRRVYYPGLPDHPQAELVGKQMRGGGGMVSFELEDGDQAHTVLRNVQVFTLAASLGGVESIISYPPLMSHAMLRAEERRRLGILDGLIRLSVGLEDAGDLIADLASALGEIEKKQAGR